MFFSHALWTLIGKIWQQIENPDELQEVTSSHGSVQSLGLGLRDITEFWNCSYWLEKNTLKQSASC